MLDVSKVTKEEALHLAHITNQLVIADRLVKGLAHAGIDFSDQHPEALAEAKKWFSSVCKEVAKNIEPKPKKIKKPAAKPAVKPKKKK